MKKFKFGDKVTLIYASERNPHKHAIFVREYIRKGKLNPGLTYQCTDGKGSFFECGSDALESMRD